MAAARLVGRVHLEQPALVGVRGCLGALGYLDDVALDDVHRRGPEPSILADDALPRAGVLAGLAARLDRQLEEQALRFLSDRSRNRYRDGRLEVSKIFDWFEQDFEPRQAYFARYAKLLGVPDGARIPDLPLTFLDYDWSLNDSRSSSRR